MIGLSTLGYSRTGRLVYPMIPKMMMNSTITVARTGRLILNSDKVMLLLWSVFHHMVNHHRHSRAQLHHTGSQQRIANIQPANHLHRRRGSHSRDDLYLAGHPVIVHVRDIASHLFHARDAGDNDGVLDLIEGDAD